MTEFTEVPSPFCGIGTDDLVIETDGLKIKVIDNGCSINTPAFEQPITDATPKINGKDVSLEKAIAKAADLLRNTNQSVIGGCATDVNGMRALLALADQNGAVIDNISFNAARRNILAMQDSGWMNTTLAELKNRCDVLLVVGTDLEQFSPRFFDLFIWNKNAMFVDQTSQREIIFLGKVPSGKAAISPDNRQPRVIECKDQALPEVLAVLRALVKNRPVKVSTVGGITIADLQQIADKLQNASYGVVTWAASALEYEHAELTVQTVCELIKDLNTKTRCSGLPLGGREGDQTANQVCGWSTGYPARCRFTSGFPEYDPFLFDSAQMLKNGEADALVWVHAFNTSAIPPETTSPTIVVGRSGMQFSKQPDVYIPVGTPGIDHPGHAYRLDNVVAIRLKKLRNSGLPSTADVLTAIQKAL